MLGAPRAASEEEEEEEANRHPTSFSTSRLRSGASLDSALHCVGDQDAYGVTPSIATAVAHGASSSSTSPSASVSSSPRTSFQNDASPGAFFDPSASDGLPPSGDDFPEPFAPALAASAYPVKSMDTKSVAAASRFPLCDASTSAMMDGSMFSNVRSSDFCSVWNAYRFAAARPGRPIGKTRAIERRAR